MLWLMSLALGADLLVGPAQPYLTIDGALDDALDGDRLLVAPGSYVEPELAIGDRTLTLEATAPGVLLRTTANRRAVTVEAGGALTLVGVDFDGESNVGLAQLRGGALTLQDVTTTATTAPIPGQPGGNIDAENATVWIERSTLDGAVSPVKDGGQIYALNSQVSVVDSVVRGGSAASGGGLFIQGGSLTIRDSTLSGHTAEEGAAIYADASDLVVEGTRFTGNHATVSSVVVCTSGPRCQVVDVTVEADRAVGPLLTITDSPASIHGSQWCRVSDAAGLMAVTGSSSLSMQGTVLQSSQTSGPALIITADAEAVLQNNTVALGEAATGGFIEADGPLVLTNNLLTGVSSPGAVVVARGGLLGGYNAYYGNVQADVDPAPLPTSLVGTDPGIGTPQSDSCALDPLRLRYGSPLVDGGDPSLFDTDKSRSDIGAFGGDAPNGGLDDVDLDGDGFSEPADCDDDDPFVNPAVAEALCNGTDDDCNPATLDDADADADGVSACSGDCDDDDPLVLPGSTEVLCNALDDDCDPTTLDAFDDDGDGVTTCEGDCDDDNEQVLPGIPEVACNGVDDDCDPATLDAIDADADGVSVCDDDCNDDNANVFEIVTVYLDQDFDGYGVGEPTSFCLPPSNSAPRAGDCDDADPTSYPGATDTPYDGVDQDCDGEDLDDLDEDGVLGADDCDDQDPFRFPGADDVPDDGVDQDCTGHDVTTTLVGGAGWRCGCSATSPAGGGFTLWGLVALVWRRRQR